MGLFGAAEKKCKTGKECFERGEDLLRKNSITTAIDYFRKGAENFHNGDCQFALGKQYVHGGINGNRNIELAFYWLKKAANNGVSNYYLFYLLGIIYLAGGEGIIADKEEALKWIKKAALIEAQCHKFIGDGYYLGALLTNPSGEFLSGSLRFEVDYVKAIEFYMEAIKDNPKDHETHEKVAKIYFDGGHGISKDYEKALLYSMESVSRDRKAYEPYNMIVEIYSEGGFGVTKNIQRAIEWCTKDGDILLLSAGHFYEYHIYPPDYKNALKCYEKAVNMDFEFLKNAMKYYALDSEIDRYIDQMRQRASVAAGILYLKGLGVERDRYKAICYLSRSRDKYWTAYLAHYGVSNDAVDYQKALKYYEEARIGRYSDEALNQIGILYRDGLGVPQNHKKAMECFTSAAEAGCSEAYNSLGDMFKYGYGMDIDFDKAFKWYTKAAEQHFDNNGQFNLGMMYLEGKGTEVNLDLALYWFVRAQAFGNEQAHSSFIISIKTLLNVVRIHNIPEAQLQGYGDVQIPIKKEPKQFFHVENHDIENIINKNSKLIDSSDKDGKENAVTR